MNAPNHTATGVRPLSPDRRLLDAGSSNGTHPASSAGAVLGRQHHTVIGYDGLKRLALMVTPEGDGAFRDQLWEVMSTIRAILLEQAEPMTLTTQTVFLRDAADAEAATKLFEAYHGERMPLTVFVVQPPCDGKRLAIEAWAISTQSAQVDYVGPHLVTVSHDGLRWVHASAGTLRQPEGSSFDQSAALFGQLASTLRGAGVPFEDVVRVWLYQGNITEPDAGIERYRELNRARTEFFAGVAFDELKLVPKCRGRTVYPASTGIGTLEHGLTTTCMALQTNRNDVELLPLENPLQTSSFDYPECYSIKSPKFSRAMAVRIGQHVTTWVSGTASIVDSETVHVGDAAKQTDQTLTNIEQLIAAENFARGGWQDAGAELADLAKIRVYVKNPDDYEAVRGVCEQRLGEVPAIYAVADVCRPDLLVEIEGVAFSSLKGGAA